MVTHSNVAGYIRFAVTLTSDKLFSVDTRSRSLLKQAAPRADNPGCLVRQHNKRTRYLVELYTNLSERTNVCFSEKQ